MRAILQLLRGWPATGWFWVVALLTLPNCSFNVAGLPGLEPNFDPGDLPRSSGIFCDIERPDTRRCASSDDLMVGVRLSAGAVALATGQRSIIVIDESPAARARCGGQPEAFTAQGSFPDGDLLCLNCGVIGTTYADANAACVARCLDVFSPTGPNVPPDPAAVAFCTAERAHASTNFLPLSACFANVCSEGGTRLDTFVDPRRAPEAVTWTDLIGVTALGNSLTRSAPETTPGAFDAGAASVQWVTRGDAYVEFSAAETNLSHVIGFAQIPDGCAFPCPDADPSLADISFAISLNRDGNFYLIEGGVLLMGPGVNGSFGTYTAGERFRVSLRDHADGTATVTYSRLVGACGVGVPCPETVFFTHTGGTPRYPFRVDASFRETAATLGDVRIVRIQ